MEQYTIYVVTVIKDDSTTSTENFSNKKNLVKWLNEIVPCIGTELQYEADHYLLQGICINKF